MADRFEKDYNSDGYPIKDMVTGKVLINSEIIDILNKYNALINEANIYLNINEFTNIGNGSILHEQIKELAE